MTGWVLFTPLDRSSLSLSLHLLSLQGWVLIDGYASVPKRLCFPCDSAEGVEVMIKHKLLH